METIKIESVGIYNSKTVAQDGVATRNRITSMFEIELPITEGGISYIEAEHSRITTDMIICAKPGQARHTVFPFKCYYVHLMIPMGYLYDTLASLPDFLRISDATEYARIFTEIAEYYGTYTRRDEIKVESLLLELIHKLACDADGQSNISSYGNKSHQMIERALEYIKANLSEDLSLERVAATVSHNPIYFHGVFKRALGKTLREYIEEQRIKRSIHLLMTTEMTLTEIAYECGFSSQSYFSYAFKRRMGTTPRRYAGLISARYGER